MSCPFAHDDAAYVLGALSPAQRLDFEAHLAGCEECDRAVRELAGLPGLLRRVDARVLEDPVADEPVPDTLLPALSRRVARARRRRALATWGLAAAAATVVAVGVPTILDQDDASQTPSSSATPGVVVHRMAPTGQVPVRATLALEQVTWGTKLFLTCTYDPHSVEYAVPPAVDYTLFVRTREGRTEQVGSWRSVGGRTMQFSAGTSAPRADIASVEVRAPDGRVVLRSRA